MSLQHIFLVLVLGYTEGDWFKTDDLRLSWFIHMLTWARHSWRQASCVEHVYGDVQSAGSLRSVGGSGGHGSAHPSAAAGREDGERERTRERDGALGEHNSCCD